MDEIKELLITGYSNVTKEGVVIHLNKRAKLKTGNILSNEFFVSWDKIGESLFDGYCIDGGVEDRNKIRLTE